MNTKMGVWYLIMTPDDSTSHKQKNITSYSINSYILV